MIECQQKKQVAEQYILLMKFMQIYFYLYMH